MRRLHVHHETVYRYARPVTFGDHRLMLRPRDSHDIRLLDTRLSLSPGGTVRWSYDVLGNSIATVSFDGPASELRISSDVLVEHYGVPGPPLPVAAYAERLPFSYVAAEAPDLARSRERLHADPEHRIDAFVQRFVNADPGTLSVLLAINTAIRQELRYEARDALGTREPVETLARGAGACRDFALLLAECARSLGLAARFVTGYLHDAFAQARGGAATHAWTEVYVPGPGWIEFDPTNGLVGGDRLVRVAVARTPEGAVPIGGSYIGAANDFLGMIVDVRVEEVACVALTDLADPATTAAAS